MKFKHISTLFFATLTALSLQSSKIDAIIAGVKTSGMGATSVAYPVDAFAGAYNPASITNLSNRIDLGFNWVQTHQGIKVRDLPTYYDPENGFFHVSLFRCAGESVPVSERQTIAPFTGFNPSSLNTLYIDGARKPNAYFPELAIHKNWDLGCLFGSLSCFNGSFPVELSTSFIFYNRNYFKTNYDRGFALLGTSRLGFEHLHETAAFVIGLRFFESHSIGVGLNYNVQRLKVNGLQQFASSFFSISPNNFTNRGYDYSHGFGTTIGYLFEWNCYKIGLAWQPKTEMQKFKKYRGFIADDGSFDLPERFTAGISYRIFYNLAVAFDYEFIRWKDIPQFNNSFFPNLNNHSFGSKNGPGFGFSNQDFYRFGVEYDLNRCISLRMGFEHTNSPIEPSRTAFNILNLEAMEDMVTFGGTWRIGPCNEISIFYGLGMQKRIRGKKSIPGTILQPNATGTGTTELIINANDSLSTITFPACNTGGIVRGNGEIDIKQRHATLGVSWGIYF